MRDATSHVTVCAVRKGLLVVAAVVVVGLACYLLWPREDLAPAATPARGSASSQSAITSSAIIDAAGSATPRVRRLSPEARAELGRKIEAARARTTASAAPVTPPALHDELKLEDVAEPLQQAFFEAIPLLADCYADRGRGFRAAARMTLSTDPELGTVIDTDTIKDGNDQPVDAALDACLRDVIDSLGLPPLGDVAGRLQLQYTFRSDED